METDQSPLELNVLYFDSSVADVILYTERKNVPITSWGRDQYRTIPITSLNGGPAIKGVRLIWSWNTANLVIYSNGLKCHFKDDAHESKLLS